MKEMLVELITSPEDLEPGDVVVYASMSKFLTAKIVKKPVLVIKYGRSYFKSTRCMVYSEVLEIHRTQRYGTITKPLILKYNIQKYNLNDFNKVKYINFQFGSGIFKVIKN